MPLSPSSQPWQVIPAGILVTSVAILGISLLMQLGFAFMPCILCLYQRIPYAVAAVLAGMALILGLSPACRRVLIALCGLAFVINACIAFYHLGVENHWWPASVCTILAPPTLSVIELQVVLEEAAEVSCDVVQWSLFGLSLSGYNLLASLGLGMFCLAVAGRKRWWRTSQNA